MPRVWRKFPAIRQECWAALWGAVGEDGLQDEGQTHRCVHFNPFSLYLDFQCSSGLFNILSPSFSNWGTVCVCACPVEAG